MSLEMTADPDTLATVLAAPHLVAVITVMKIITDTVDQAEIDSKRGRLLVMIEEDLSKIIGGQIQEIMIKEDDRERGLVFSFQFGYMYIQTLYLSFHIEPTIHVYRE